MRSCKVDTLIVKNDLAGILNGFHCEIDVSDDLSLIKVNGDVQKHIGGIYNVDISE